MNIRLLVQIAAVALVFALIPLFSDDSFLILTLKQMGIAVILAISYNLLLGKAGLLSLGHAVYFGFGGFLAVQIANNSGAMSIWTSVPLMPFWGALAGGVMAVILGSFTTKRGGVLFAMLSIAMAELVISSSSVFGRFYGGSIDRTELGPFFDLNFQSDISIFYVVLVWSIGVILCAKWFSSSPVGRMAQAVGQNPDRVEYLGYSQFQLKYRTFCLSGMIAGIAGALFALAYEFVTVEIISLQQSWSIMQMVFIGGTGFFWGPPIGAVLLTFMFSTLSGLTELWGLYIGVVFIAVVMFAPAGLTGLVVQISQKLRSNTEPHYLKELVLNTGAVVLTAIVFVGICEGLYALKQT